jgi:SAM-dependent MidA family methyltransferase
MFRKKKVEQLYVMIDRHQATIDRQATTISESKSDLEVVNDLWTETINENKTLGLMNEVISAHAVGACKDLAELQIEHDALLESYGRVNADREVLQEIGTSQDEIIFKLEADLKNCNNRSEKYRLRSIKLGQEIDRAFIKLGDVERALRGSIR